MSLNLNTYRSVLMDNGNGMGTKQREKKSLEIGKRTGAIMEDNEYCLHCVVEWNVNTYIRYHITWIMFMQDN
jgi:hypothetical protein